MPHSRYREEPTIDPATARDRLRAAGYDLRFTGAMTIVANKGESYLCFTCRLNRQHLTCYSEQAINTAAQQ